MRTPVPPYVPECFLPYWGNNHLEIEPNPIRYGGMVSFKDHFGKPLSPDLWDDLVHRLGISSLRVYGEAAEQWCDGSRAGAARIHLDAAGNVVDIEWKPWRDPRIEIKPGPWRFEVGPDHRAFVGLDGEVEMVIETAPLRSDVRKLHGTWTGQQGPTRLEVDRGAIEEMVERAMDEVAISVVTKQLAGLNKKP